MNPCMESLLIERIEAGDNTLRLYLWLPPELAPLAWEFEGALSDVLERAYGSGSATVGVSSTCGTSDVSMTLGGGRRAHIYIETPGGYPL